MHYLTLHWFYMGMLLFLARKGQQYVLKSCKQSTSCYEDLTAIKYGEGETVFTKVSCCKGNGCNKATPSLPDVNMTANGKKCKGCFAINRGQCNSKVFANCEGDQHYCSDVSGFAEFPSPIFAGPPFLVTVIAFKGCANKAFCDAHYEGVFHTSMLVVTARGHCQLASLMVRAAPQYFGLFLRALVGLLLAMNFA
ncbi:phospholipase A2 inhibitor and Ly6/PLAUR domain-containing protein-like [Lacerta agilis]|uniref:phospholipase A2 inhibitor and Ly6/PLAUR domain-containing protein-like n=1 Tax=Lacerta agilis TaxID=80427 RepID=UPI001419B3E1|nr:phospholipase A2 inhibitor and Ly6/PLAUR domain-containing protein-like [Lacerta agilis]